MYKRQFHHFAQVHDRHMGGDVLYHTQIMGDEDQRDAQLLLQVHEQVDDLGLDRHIQGGDALVTDDQLGTDGQGAGNTKPLALAAGKLMEMCIRDSYGGYCGSDVLRPHRGKS